MRRIVLLVPTAIVMAALILASALPALAAPPTFSATYIYRASEVFSGRARASRGGANRWWQ